MEYMFDSSSYKMTNCGAREDLLSFVGKGRKVEDNVKREAKRVARFYNQTG